MVHGNLAIFVYILRQWIQIIEIECVIELRDMMKQLLKERLHILILIKSREVTGMIIFENI